jgi:hypothetical protein
MTGRGLAAVTGPRLEVTGFAGPDQMAVGADRGRPHGRGARGDPTARCDA